jgi:hypothetical protein
MAPVCPAWPAGIDYLAPNALNLPVRLFQGAQDPVVPFPARVRFVSQMDKYPAAYWVHLDGLTPGLPASIEARFTAPNRLAITTQHLEGFSLHPGRPSPVRS